jgi:putative transposase
LQQEAEVQDIQAELPDYEAVHAHLLQAGLARRDTTDQAGCRRVPRGESAGFPRGPARKRWHAFTFTAYGNGVRLATGHLVLCTIGRIAVRWSRPVEGTPKTVTLATEAESWSVAIACAEVPTQPLPSTGQPRASTSALSRSPHWPTGR